MWEIEFYRRANGQEPFMEFLQGLSPTKDVPYIQNALAQLAEHGHGLDRPHAAYLRDDIFELRVRTIHGHFRCLYFFFHRTKVIVTHGFKKKTAKVPEAEIERAITYRRAYLEENEKGSR